MLHEQRLNRCGDWQQALYLFCEANAGRRFEWGSWDCCLFVADAIDAMAGVDIAAEFRGRYGTYREALKLTQRLCGNWPLEVVVEKVAAEHGMREVPVALAQRGDMLLVDNGRRPVLGIVALNGTEIFVIGERLRRVPIALARRAWRV
ncbi:MAG: hypothetical protein ABSH20_25535 [Tepidisphaeraceae bacterium]|jgi:hypothetical protein